MVSTGGIGGELMPQLEGGTIQQSFGFFFLSSISFFFRVYFFAVFTFELGHRVRSAQFKCGNTFCHLQIKVVWLCSHLVDFQTNKQKKKNSEQNIDAKWNWLDWDAESVAIFESAEEEEEEKWIENVYIYEERNRMPSRRKRSSNKKKDKLHFNSYFCQETHWIHYLRPKEKSE